MRTASVAQGEGARLAAAVSLILAAAKVRDHVADGDGLLAHRPAAVAARRLAANWSRAGRRSGAVVGFDTAVLVDAVERQSGIEAHAGPGTSLLSVTEPTETATAAAFAHTAHLARRPANAAPLAEAGRLFGRLAHLLDAVEDQQADADGGAWNPLTATGTGRAEARRLADDALHGIRLALKDVAFPRPGGRRSEAERLAHVLLVHELRRSVDRAFGTSTCAHPAPSFSAPDASTPQGAHQPGPYVPPRGGPGRRARPGSPDGRPDAPDDPRQWPGHGIPQGPGGPGEGGGHGGGPGGGPHFGPPRPGRRGLLAGCAVAVGLCCTCKVCCADEFEGPWSRQQREGLCANCDCPDCSGCDCGCGDCGCCDGDCGCCDCGCDC